MPLYNPPTAASPGAPKYSYVSQSSTLNPAAINTWYVLSGASFTVTLPDATLTGYQGESIVLQHNGTSLTQVYTLNTTSAQTINGPGGTVASGAYALYTNGEKLILMSDGSNWQAVDHVTATGETNAGALTISATSAYTFTIASASIGAGTVYTANGNTFICSTTTASSTTFTASGTGSPGASGTLTYVSGPTSGNKAFSSVALSVPVKGSATNDNFIWWRQGKYCFYRNDVKLAAGTAGTGDYAFYWPTGLVPDSTNLQTSIAFSGSGYPLGVSNVGSAYGVSATSGWVGAAYIGAASQFKLIISGQGVMGGAIFSLSNATTISILGSYPVTGWQP